MTKMEVLVSFMVYAYNTAYHVTSSFTPFFLIFNRLSAIPYDHMMESPVEKPPEIWTHTAEVAEKVWTAHTIVQKQTRMAFGRAKH